MRVKTCMGLKRFEVDKTRAFSLGFPEIPETMEILEMGFSGEWVVLKNCWEIIGADL